MPLRPELYNRLCARARQYGFGTIRIRHDNCEMRATVEKDALTGKPRLIVHDPGEYYTLNCPFCNDTRGRLWINHMWGYLYPQTKNRNLWLAVCYNEGCLSRPGKAKRLYQMIFEDILNGRDRHFSDAVLPGQRPSHRPQVYKAPGPILYPLQALPHDHHALLYLRSRGYDPLWLSRALGVSYCPQAYPEFSLATDRIIVPITFNGNLVGWQARYIGDCPHGVPKYCNQTGMKKTEIVYNFEHARRYRYVIICEGCTDVWRVGPPAVALFGKTLSPTQRALLTTTWANGTAVVLLDGEAPEEARAVYDALGSIRQRVLISLPQGTDPGDLSHDELWRTITEAASEQGVQLFAGTR